MLTNENKCGIIIKLSHERMFRTEFRKKIQKNLKKLLTNKKQCDIIIKSLNERNFVENRQRILKIKQRSYLKRHHARNYFEKLYFLKILQSDKTLKNEMRKRK